MVKLGKNEKALIISKRYFLKCMLLDKILLKFGGV